MLSLRIGDNLAMVMLPFADKILIEKQFINLNYAIQKKIYNVSVTYNINNILLDDKAIKAFNKFNSSEEKLKFLKQYSNKFLFYQFENEDANFKLTLIDSNMPLLLASVIKEIYFNDLKSISMNKLKDIMNESNILKVPIEIRDKFYEFKLKKILYLMLADILDGSRKKHKSNFIGVLKTKNNELLYLDSYNRDEIINYIFDNIEIKFNSDFKNGIYIKKQGCVYLDFKLCCQLK